MKTKSDREKMIDTFGCGFLLWLVGFGISMMLFLAIPITLLGWIVLVVMVPATAFLAVKRLWNSKEKKSYYYNVGIVWALIAILMDYIFLVKGFNVQDYYKLDVYIYYFLNFLIPVAMGMKLKVAK